jgi:hypothetical protein
MSAATLVSLAACAGSAEPTTSRPSVEDGDLTAVAPAEGCTLDFATAATVSATAHYPPLPAIEVCNEL